MNVLDGVSFRGASRSVSFHRLLCLVFLLVTGAIYFAASSSPGTRGAYYIAIHLALSTLMICAILTNQESNSKKHSWTLRTGLLARVLLLGVPAFTTTDVHRYLWDGFAALAGLDPYRVTPEMSAAQIAVGWPKPINSAGYATLYPPGALGLYAFSAAFGERMAFWVWKALTTGASVLTLLIIRKLLSARNCERYLPLVAFSPLLILESGVGAHVDAFSGLSVAAALLALERRSLFLSGAFLGVGGLIKFLPLAAVFPIAVVERRNALRLIIGAFSVMICGYTVALILGFHPLGSLIVFFQKWRFGAPIYSATAFLFERNLSRFFAVCAALAIFTTALLKHPASKVVWFLAFPLLISPVVFPWYLIAVVVATSVYPSAFMMIWAMTMPLTYEVIDRFDSSGVWRTAIWPLWVIGFGWVVGFLVDASILPKAMRDFVRQVHIRSRKKMQYSVTRKNGAADFE